MTLTDFIASPLRNAWIKEPGLAYYVRKSQFFPGAIELATCQASPKSKVFGLWRFLRRYSADIPFFMEQVLNEDLARYMRKLKWLEKDMGGTPQFASPLAVKTYTDHKWFKSLWLEIRDND